MHFALVLVTAADTPLSTAHIAHIQTLLNECAVPDDDQRGVKWLSPHRAAELYIHDQLTSDQRQKLKTYTDKNHIDLFCIEESSRQKQLLLADMDSTIVAGETLDEIAVKAGVGEKVMAITARAMKGELNFEEALKERANELKGQPASLLDSVKNNMILNDGADILVKTMAKHGATCVLVSGGFTYFTADIAKRCGFAYHHGNVLESDGDVLTGRVEGRILGREAKEEYLNHYLKKLKLDNKYSLTVGDGANDLSMLEAAGLGIGYQPKPALEEALPYHIKHSNLTALLYIQGYSEKQFVK